ncbi:MAG: hypothetical protein A6F71_08030 [Cycloclasticus sp. symbiont of Poecilosclerida sp. M]|nr:MAG: hypothetical protein A6F71_08030 [Cycloclasticus sp. symbiont of Poecilosclerida sp. M]
MAIFLVSAHWETAVPSISGNDNSETIYDFAGFSDDIYTLEYPAPSGKVVASAIAQKVGFIQDHQRGLDHGAWTPLFAMYPDVDIPVMTLSVSPSKGCEFAFKLGEQLGCLRKEGVLIIASGGLVHNLSMIDWANVYAPEASWASSVMSAIDAQVKTRVLDTVLKPFEMKYAEKAFTSLEHYLPFLIALGALEGDEGKLFCDVWRYRTLSMHSYQFG